MITEPRRAFLAKLSVTAPALGLVGAAAVTAEATESAPTRRAIRGAVPLPFSRGVAFGKLVYVSGVVGNKPGSLQMASASFAAQCRQAMDNLKASVEACGSTMSNVIKCTCFLTQAGDFAAFNKLFASYFPDSPPARSTVVVKELVVEGANIEIDCVTCLT